MIFDISTKFYKNLAFTIIIFEWQFPFLGIENKKILFEKNPAVPICLLVAQFQVFRYILMV
ncbi:hypothetical protein KIS4809_4844 [Bacillus sp. ZZV12-4809]|nr:hypothetical protein KIS4809_4844 [Bacillus sp. ZZV12-4809]